MLRKLIYETKNSSSGTISCINGYLDKINNKCICYPGWETNYYNLTSNIIEECNHNTGLNKTNEDIRNILKNGTSISLYQNKENNVVFIIICLFINISLILFFWYYYKRCKKKYDDELEKCDDSSDFNMSEKETLEYEMNYFSGAFGFIPVLTHYTLRSYKKDNNKIEKNDNSKDEKKIEVPAEIRNKYIDLIKPKNEMKESDNNDVEEVEDNENDINKV